MGGREVGRRVEAVAWWKRGWWCAWRKDCVVVLCGVEVKGWGARGGVW